MRKTELKKLRPILSASVLLVFFGASKDQSYSQSPGVSAADTSAQARAIQRFPEIGVAGSEANKRFLSAVEEAKKSRPSLFDLVDWPMQIALETESLKMLQMALSLNNSISISKQASSFKNFDKDAEKEINALGFELSKIINKSQAHLAAKPSVAEKAARLRRNAETNDRYVPFRPEDTSGKERATTLRRQADEMEAEFEREGERLRTEQNRISKVLSERARYLSEKAGGEHRMERGPKTYVSGTSLTSIRATRASILGVLTGRNGNFELNDRFRHDLAEWRILHKYNTAADESSWFEDFEEDLKKHKSEALLTQAVHRIWAYLPEKNRNQKIAGKTYLELSLDQLSEVHDKFALAVFLEGLSKICFPPNSASGESLPGIQLLEEASRRGSEWSKIELENIIQLPETERRGFALELLGSILAMWTVDWHSAKR